MKTFIALLLTVVSLRAADVAISDLTIITTPSTNSYMLLSDMNEATKSRKYLFTNLVTQTTFLSGLADYLPLTSTNALIATATNSAKSYADATFAPIANPTFTGTINGDAMTLSGTLAVDAIASQLAAGPVEMAIVGPTTNLIESPVTSMLYKVFTNDVVGTGRLVGESELTDGNVVSTGASTAGAIAAYSGTDGTNVAPTLVTVTAQTNLNAGAVFVNALKLTGFGGEQAGGTNSFSLEQSTTAVAGNQLGVGAVDLQVGRSTATFVASARNSFAAGTNNSASANYTVVLGQGNNATYANAIAIGLNNTAGSQTSVALGENCQSTGNASISIGSSAGSPRSGQFSHASGQFAANADAQFSRLIVRNATANATPTELYCNGSSLRMTVPNHTTWYCRIMISARGTDAGTAAELSACYTQECLVERDADAASTALVWDPGMTTLFEDDAAWDADIAADTTNGSLNVLVTGKAATNIRWVAVVEFVQVGG